MAKQTLLDIVQDILSDADGDEINSITDTIESEQCARVVRDAYLQITDVHDFESTKSLVELDATGASTPNVMTRPEGVHSIEFIKYDSKIDAGANSSYKTIHYMEVADFLTRVHSRTTDDADTDEITIQGTPIPVRNNVAPKYYTIMDSGDNEIVFDSYNSALETNLQQSKSLAYATVKPTYVLDDATVMSLPKHLESLIKRTARAMYFDLYKDGVTSEIDRTRRRAETRAQRLRHIVKNADNDKSPNYGRK